MRNYSCGRLATLLGRVAIRHPSSKTSHASFCARAYEYLTLNLVGVGNILANFGEKKSGKYLRKKITSLKKGVLRLRKERSRDKNSSKQK